MNILIRDRGIIKRLKTKQEESKDIDTDFDNEDMTDQELWEIIKELHGEKLVIISECTYIVKGLKKEMK